VPTAQHIATAEALRIYRYHQNDPSDVNYRRFLNQLASHLPARLTPGAHGLDYGSGPGPTLAVMLAEQGFAMRWYDPLFAPDQGALHERYDFITCSETAEHFAAPAIEFQRLNSLLRPGGWLGVMTRILEDDAAFPQWWYHRDLTHIAFYRRETMNWIATRYGWRLEMPAPNVALFQKAPPRI
jgi:2-polyprenyl-3-methyl-5-hydroxy-6-metoxy-1,4-benzoquinol methylase